MSRRPANAVRELIETHRWAALATVDGRGEPLASMVAYAGAGDGPDLLLHLSELARHTRNLLAGGQGCLAISAPDPGRGDPQTLARLSLSGRATVVAPDADGYLALVERYVARFPESEPRFALGDFRLFRFVPDRGRYVGGFAAAHTLDRDALCAAAGSGSRIAGN